MNPFNKKKAPSYDDGLDKVLYRMPGTKVDITHADAVEGSIVFGSPGSGKSSGVGKFIALSMLKKNFGFCVLCAKPGERKVWENYAKLTGRENDLVIFNKRSTYSFNFMEYEMSRPGEGAGETLNIVNYLMSLHEMMQSHLGGGQSKDERFWDQALKRCISNGIDLLKLARQEVSINNLKTLIATSFNERELEEYLSLRAIMDDPDIEQDYREKKKEEYLSFVDNNYFLYVFEKANEREDLDEDQVDTMQIVGDYFIKEFPNLSDKTRGIIIESFMGVLLPFLSGILKKKFTSGLSEELRPENIYKKRKIVIIDFPVKEFGLTGIMAAGIYKTIFQASMERRDWTKEENPDPVGYWIDEFHQFISPSSDAMFQTTCRESRVASIYITQNLNNLIFSFGRQMPQARAKSLIGNINLKYFCSNADADTNQFAANMIGRAFIDITSTTVRPKQQKSQSYNQQLHYKVPPEDFTTLKTGRSVNKFKVDAIVFKAGKIWDKEGSNYARVEFDQNEI